MVIAENSYGIRKRLGYIASQIHQNQPSSVLDFGCGTGRDITLPLADQFPSIKFYGVDTDQKSIEYAQSNFKKENLFFSQNHQFSDEHVFDMIICSEVIEHVEHPERLLIFLSERLSRVGILVLTLPNGFGPFEFVSFFQTLLHISRIIPFLRRLKRQFFPPRSASPLYSLAVSPHINFFSNSQINHLILASGFQVLNQRSRTFLCGLGWDQILFSKKLIDINVEVADKLPFWMNSGWMFTLQKGPLANPGYRYNRGWWGRVRKYLNTRACGI